MSTDKDILTKEIGSWGDFGYAFRKENRILFEEMLDRCKKKEYVDCAANKGENFSAETLLLVLIFEQQKMINELIRKLGKVDRDVKRSPSEAVLVALSNSDVAKALAL